jgi:hypothetical protein
MSYCIDITKKLKIGLDDIDNLILNMLSGLLPENLTEYQCLLLTEKYGENWFEVLGYSEPAYKKPKIIEV